MESCKVKSAHRLTAGMRPLRPAKRDASSNSDSSIVVFGGGRSAVEMVWGDLERDGMVCKSARGRIRVRGVI